MSEIYDIIDKYKLDIVLEPISKAHGLPNECYISKEYTLIERKKLFEDKWIVIGVGSSIPNAGDVKPIDLLGMPILIVRTKKNEIKVFHNICSHRGVKLVDKPGFEVEFISRNSLLNRSQKSNKINVLMPVKGHWKFISVSFETVLNPGDTFSVPENALLAFSRIFSLRRLELLML